eukprot:gene12983-13112_t
MQIAVQTLDGHRLEVVVDPNGTVKDLRQQLQQQHGLAKCALYFKARPLSVKTSLRELQLKDKECVPEVMVLLFPSLYVQTALATLGATLAANLSQQRHGTAPTTGSTGPLEATHTAEGDPEQQQQQSALDTLLPGYASRPNPSPVKKKAAAAARRKALQCEDPAAATALDDPAQMASAPTSIAQPWVSNSSSNSGSGLAADGCLSGGGFIIAGHQQNVDGWVGRGKSSSGGGGGDLAPGQLPVYKSSRKRQGRTLLQEHIMLQHDMKQAAALKAQQQQQQVAGWTSEEAQPFNWSRSETSALQGLPLPPVLHSLLLLHRHLETCYSFLLQQHIQPRWGRLLDLMGSLFPQGRRGRGKKAAKAADADVDGGGDDEADDGAGDSCAAWSDARDPGGHARGRGRGRGSGASKTCRTARSKADAGALALKEQSSRSRRRSIRNAAGGGADIALESTCMQANNSSRASAWDPILQRRWHPLFVVDMVHLQDVTAAVEGHQGWLLQQNGQFGSLPAGAAAGGAGWQQQVLVARPTRTAARSKPCTTCQPLTAPEFLEHLKTLSWYRDQVVHLQPQPARTARYSQPSTPLGPSTTAALAARGISQLFVHQAAAVDALCGRRQHVVIATSTASGKSLCYNIPMLEELRHNPQACFLFLFPTKALAQDQLKVLRQLLADAFGPDAAPVAEVYDGDTPQQHRPAIREAAQLLVTNPDMLHQSVLPCHSSFERLLTNLAMVVVDEGHAYQGAFGCHTAVVLRRLQRLCKRGYGSRPRFVVTSATIANPLEHSALLLGVARDELLLVAEDGSPHGPKDVVLWNPPLTAMVSCLARRIC